MTIRIEPLRIFGACSASIILYQFTINSEELMNFSNDKDLLMYLLFIVLPAYLSFHYSIFVYYWPCLVMGAWLLFYSVMSLLVLGSHHLTD